jgi:PhzF family phenazine biosynthesis protein
MRRRFAQVDVFASDGISGNPLAVVLDGIGLTDAQMQQFANWTNLSETTFVLPPTEPDADYAVRIFTTSTELPFAGHPTLGTCHAWLEADGTPKSPDRIVQQCAAGLIPIMRTVGGLAFCAPPLVRSGPIDTDTMQQVSVELGLPIDDIVAAEWIDNGPGWIGVRIAEVNQLLALRPVKGTLKLGVCAPAPSGVDYAFEVRAFFPSAGTFFEDPVTGSLNAGLAQWMLQSGVSAAPYRVRQGSVLGRNGRVLITQEADGSVWVGGNTNILITGHVDL